MTDHPTSSQMPTDATRATAVLNAEPDWFRTAVFYEVLVRSFRDSNGDGTGDFKGLIEKLDYLEWLGVDAVWISPVTKNIEGKTAYGEAYHGYWQQDLYAVNGHYGTSDDLKALASALHGRGMVSLID